MVFEATLRRKSYLWFDLGWVFDQRVWEQWIRDLRLIDVLAFANHNLADAPMLLRWFAVNQSWLLFALLPAQTWVSCYWKWSLLWEISAWTGFGQVWKADLRNTSAEVAVLPDVLQETEPTLWVLRRFACENGRAVNVRCFLAAIDIVAQKTPLFSICWLFLLRVIVRYFTDPRVSGWFFHLLDWILGLFLVAWVPGGDWFDIVKFGSVISFHTQHLKLNGVKSSSSEI